jgi:hypothetical protein
MQERAPRNSAVRYTPESVRFGTRTQELRQLLEILRVDVDAAVLCEEHLQDSCILESRGRADGCEHARGQSQIEPDCIGMARASSTSGADNHLVVPGARTNFVD